MKRALKITGGLLVLCCAVGVAVPVFLVVAGLGPVFVSVLVTGFVLLLLWFVLGRRRVAVAGPASESSFLRQTSKDGLL